MINLLNKLTNFLSIKAIVFSGVFVMTLVIVAFASTMVYLSSTIKYDQISLKKILLLENQNKDIINIIKEINYIDTEILLAKDNEELEKIEDLLLEETSNNKNLDFKRNIHLEKKYNYSIKRISKLINSEISLQSDFYDKARMILFYKNELNDYLNNINQKIEIIIKTSNSISSTILLKKKRLHRKIQKDLANNKNISSSIQILFSKDFETIGRINKKLDLSILDIQKQINSIIYEKDMDLLNYIISNKLVQTKTLIDNSLEKLNALLLIDKEKISEIRTNFINIKEIISYIVNAKNQILIHIIDLNMLKDKKDILNKELFNTINELNTYSNTIKIDILNNSDSVTKRSTFIVIVVGLILLFLILFSGATLISRINMPLDTIISFIKNISSNKINLLENIPIEVEDEFGQLSNTFNHMTSSLHENMNKIKELNIEIEDTQKEVIFTMGAIGESRSKETGNHVRRVAAYSVILATKYHLSEHNIKILKEASPMHDIGKVGIPDSILKKNDVLNAEEWKIMKTHAQLGYDMLKHSKREILKTASIVAYEHHEKWDGTGYPRGLKKEEIHIFGRITAVADVFDALGSSRCYKKAWPLDKLLKLFKEEKGKHFEPKLVDILFENIDEFLEIQKKYKDIY